TFSKRRSTRTGVQSGAAEPSVTRPAPGGPRALDWPRPAAYGVRSSDDSYGRGPPGMSGRSLLADLDQLRRQLFYLEDRSDFYRDRFLAAGLRRSDLAGLASLRDLARPRSSSARRRRCRGPR